jgi:hypothetical protein
MMMMMTTMTAKSVEMAIVESKKEAPPKVDDHIRVVLKHIVLKHIVLKHIVLKHIVLKVPDILTAPASIDLNPITKGLLIKGLQNKESSHRLHMIRQARADFVLR